MHRFCLIVFVLLSLSAGAKTKRALVVGIGEYPKESGWTVVHGDNDLWITVQMLISVGFEEKNIMELSNSYATKDNIIACLGQIVSSSRPGDVVYLHFSGHGQLMTDLDGDEEDGYDESFVPYDAEMYYSDTDNGNKHLSDDEIAIYLGQIKKAIGDNGRIIAVIDACHSGKGTHNIKQYNRDSHATDSFMTYGEVTTENDFYRGTDRVFKIPSRNITPFVKENEPIEVSISACDSGEVNFELLVSGNYYGRLTSVIYHLLWNNPDVTVGEIEVMVKDRMTRLNTRFIQHPVFEYGSNVKPDQFLFGE